MSNYSVFDIIGPIMVGPSSSHTAGATKLGQMARALFDATPTKASFVLHGSFASVYKGHATDKALLAGIMKFHTSDERIKNAFELADEKGITYEFDTGDLGINYHPNTVKIILENDTKKIEIIGSSIGGGNIVIKNIDGFEVDLTGSAGKAYTIALSHDDKSTTYAKIMNFIAESNCEIINVQSSRVDEEKKVLTLISISERPTLEMVLNMEKIDGVHFARALNKLT